MNNTGWISIQERLPTKQDADMYGNVLVYYEFGCEIKPYAWVKGGTYSHWMSLPKPPGRP